EVCRQSKLAEIWVHRPDRYDMLLGIETNAALDNVVAEGALHLRMSRRHAGQLLIIERDRRHGNSVWFGNVEDMFEYLFLLFGRVLPIGLRLRAISMLKFG